MLLGVKSVSVTLCIYWACLSGPPSTNNFDVPAVFKIIPPMPYSTTDSFVLLNVDQVTTIS